MKATGRPGCALRQTFKVTTYTIKRSHSAQMFCPGGSCGVDDGGFVSGAGTCLSPATPKGAVTIPELAEVSGSKFHLSSSYPTDDTTPKAQKIVAITWFRLSWFLIGFLHHTKHSAGRCIEVLLVLLKVHPTNPRVSKTHFITPRKTYPSTPGESTSAWAESVSAIVCSEYKPKGVLYCLLTNLGPPLTAPLT